MSSLFGMLRGSAIFSAVALTVFVTTGAQARDFTYAGWGGGLQDAQREAYLKAYSQQAGKPFKEDVYLGGTAKFEAMKASKDVSWDVVNVESGVLQRGCDEGTFVKLDYSKVGRTKDDFIGNMADNCGIPSYTWAFAVAYDANVIKEGPQSYADFWNTTKWPGRRGMRKGPLYNLEVALLADGVAAKDIYKTLSTKEGLERAFKKLDAIKSQVVWWEAPAQTPELLGSGNVSLIIAPNARISGANKGGKNFKMAFKPGLVGTDYWVLVNGSPNVDDAYKFLSIASDPKNQAAFSSNFAYAPTVKAAPALLSPETVASLPVGDAVAGALSVSSAEHRAFWADNGDKIREQWNVWLTK